MSVLGDVLYVCVGVCACCASCIFIWHRRSIRNPHARRRIFIPTRRRRHSYSAPTEAGCWRACFRFRCKTRIQQIPRPHLFCLVGWPVVVAHALTEWQTCQHVNKRAGVCGKFPAIQQLCCCGRGGSRCAHAWNVNRPDKVGETASGKRRNNRTKRAFYVVIRLLLLQKMCLCFLGENNNRLCPM